MDLLYDAGRTGIYWIVNSILGILRDVSLTKVFNKQLDKLDAERIAREKERDAELERKRLETERLKAAGETVVNPNTSKKKIQASQKQKDDERKAAAMREERAARRERLGVEQAAAPESQVATAAMRVAVPMRGIIISRTRLPLRRRSSRCPRVPKENRRVLNDVENTGKVRQDGRGGDRRRARGAWP